MTASPAEGKAIRAFVALPLDAAVLGRVAETVEDLRPRVKAIRWTRPEGLHLTLRFLGPSSPQALARMEPALRAAASACPAIVARVSGLGVFPEHGSPRVLWLGIALDDGALVLQHACERAAIDAGFAPEGRAFRPHLTLGRWRDRASRPSLPDVDLGETVLDRLVLFRSDLRPAGAVYTPLGVFLLGRL